MGKEKGRIALDFIWKAQWFCASKSETVFRINFRESYYKVALLSSSTHQMMVLPSNGGPAHESQDDSTTDIEMCTTRRQILRRQCRNTVSKLVMYESYSTYSGWILVPLLWVQSGTSKRWTSQEIYPTAILYLFHLFFHIIVFIWYNQSSSRIFYHWSHSSNWRTQENQSKRGSPLRTISI